ncbi:MAG TPA: hypothetical protein VMN77_03300 [Nitrospiria bacterium]|jgi:hypothetical protein|nr:hypothetical protein [Nitrospiria bacterium]
MFYYLLIIIVALVLSLWPVWLVLGIFYRLRKKKSAGPASDKTWYLQIALSKEDAVGQLFLVLSFFFLGLTLLALNRDLGHPVSWRTILLVASVAGLVNAYFLKVHYSLAVGLVGFSCWWGAQAAEWIQGKGIQPSAGIAGWAFVVLIFYALGRLHENERRWRRFVLVYLVLGIFPMTVALFIFSTKTGLDILGEMTKGAPFLDSLQITLSLLLLSIFLAGVMLYAIGNKLISPFEFFAVLILTVLFGAMALLPQQTMFPQAPSSYFTNGGSELSSRGVLWALIFNLVTFLEIIGLIFLGYVRREIWLINLGTIFMVLLIFFKYLDWSYPFLDKSIFFIVAGLLLFAVGWFMEKGRRYMISNIKGQTQQVSK